MKITYIKSHIAAARRSINFDMDGTIADLYGVKDWLALLRSEIPRHIGLPLRCVIWLN